MHIASEGSKLLSISQAKEHITKELEKQYSVFGVNVGITSFNELSEEDYEASK